MVRRLWPIETAAGTKPRGFVQIAAVDGQRNAQTSYRPWLSDPTDPDYRFTRDELSRLKGHSAAIDPDQGFILDEGMPKNELVDFKRYHSAEVHYGVPKVIAALSAVYGQIYSEARNLRFFINRGVPDYIVTIEGDNAAFLDESPGGAKSQIDKFQKNLEEHMKNLLQGEDHRTYIAQIPKDQIEIKWEKVTAPVADQDHEVYELRNRDKVIRAYRIQPNRLGIEETASLGTGTGENQSETYKKAQLDPRQGRKESFVNQCFDEMGWDLLGFHLHDVDIKDEERAMGILEKAVNTKAMSINEIRERLNDIYPNANYKKSEHSLANTAVFFLELANGGPIIMPAGMPAVSGMPGADGSPQTALPGGEPRALRKQGYREWSAQTREAYESKREMAAKRLGGNGRREEGSQ